MGFHGCHYPMTVEHLTKSFQNPFDIWNSHWSFVVAITLLSLLLSSSTFLVLLIQTFPNSPEWPLRVPLPYQSLVHMIDLSCCISLLGDDVVTLIIEGVDDFLLMVEQVVGVKIQVLASVGHFCVYLNFPPPSSFREIRASRKGMMPSFSG